MKESYRTWMCLGHSARAIHTAECREGPSWNACGEIRIIRYIRSPYRRRKERSRQPMISADSNLVSVDEFVN